jgi:hypothetical protein
MVKTLTQGGTFQVKNNDTMVKADFNKKIQVHFDGGPITTDAGLLLLREFEGRVPFMDIVARHVNFRRPAAEHDDVSVVRQMVYRFVAGYEDDVDANSLRADALLPLLLQRDTFASQPTVSRCVNYYNMTDVWAFQRGNLAVLAAVEDACAMSGVTLDFDTTDIPSHGHQQGTRNNVYYDERARQAMFCFNQHGACVKSGLMNGTAAASKNVLSFCKGPVRHYLNRGVAVRIRGDRAFGSEALYKWCEKRCVRYYLRLKTQRTEDTLRELCGQTLAQEPGRPGVYYGEYRNKPTTWTRERRVCMKIQPKAGELFPEVMCVVTSDETMPARDVISFYEDRGACENNIKEMKNGFSCKRLSHTTFAASAMRLQIITLAYNIINLMRTHCMPAPLRTHHIQTLRVKILKLAARIIRTSRRIILRCPAAYPYTNLFTQTHTGILNLKTATG